MAIPSLVFTTSPPDEVAKKLNYKALSGPITASMFSAPDAKNYQPFAVPVEPFVVPNNYSLNDLWTVVWGPKAFLERYKEKRNETKLECPPWEFNADRSCATRLIKDIVVVDSPIPDTPTSFVEAHRVIACQRGGKHEIWFQHSAQTPDVISGTSFRVELLILATAANATSAPVTLTFSFNMIKCSAAFYAVKFIAFPRANKETADAMRLYCTVMKDYIASQPLPAVKGAAGASASASSSPNDEKALAIASQPASPSPSSLPPTPSAAPAAALPPMAAPPPPTTPFDVLVALGPAIGMVVALLVMGSVASGAMRSIDELERTAELQSRRWAFIEKHVGGPFGRGLGDLESLMSVAGGSGGPSSYHGAGGGAPPYAQFMQQPSQHNQQQASAPPSSSPSPSSSSSHNLHSQSRQTASDENGGGGIPPWAAIVVGEVATLQSRLANAYWLIAAQFAILVALVVKRFAGRSERRGGGGSGSSGGGGSGGSANANVGGGSASTNGGGYWSSSSRGGDRKRRDGGVSVNVEGGAELKT